MIDPIILWLSFLAGIGMFFNPCSVALLPAYIGLILRQGGYAYYSALPRALVGLRIGAMSSLGILIIFLSAGLLISAVGNVLAPYAVWYGSITGVVLIFLGFFLFFGRSIQINLPHRLSVLNTNLGFFIFGIGYAIGSIGCTLPAFLLVVFAALGKGAITGFLNFLAFSSGIIVLLIGVSLTSALSQTLVASWLTKHIKLFQGFTALVIFTAGLYLLWFNLRAFVF